MNQVTFIHSVSQDGSTHSAGKRSEEDQGISSINNSHSFTLAVHDPLPAAGSELCTFCSAHLFVQMIKTQTVDFYTMYMLPKR